MAPRPILRWPDPRLTAKCLPASVDDGTLTLARDMLETMYQARGRGLAAPQVGVLTRVFVMDSTWKSGPGTPETFINPEILWRSDNLVTRPEACLSIKGVLADIARATEIILRWTMPDGSVSAERLKDFRAICAQHEIDHLDGILMFGHMPPDARAKAQAEAQAEAQP